MKFLREFIISKFYPTMKLFMLATLMAFTNTLHMEEASGVAATTE